MARNEQIPKFFAKISSLPLCSFFSNIYDYDGVDVNYADDNADWVERMEIFTFLSFLSIPRNSTKPYLEINFLYKKPNISKLATESWNFRCIHFGANLVIIINMISFMHKSKFQK